MIIAAGEAEAGEEVEGGGDDIDDDDDDAMKLCLFDPYSYSDINVVACFGWNIVSIVDRKMWYSLTINVTIMAANINV
jgi:hypothetical protein